MKTTQDEIEKIESDIKWIKKEGRKLGDKKAKQEIKTAIAECKQRIKELESQLLTPEEERALENRRYELIKKQESKFNQ